MPSSSQKVKTMFSKPYRIQKGCHCCKSAMIELEPVLCRRCDNNLSMQYGKDVHPAGICNKYGRGHV
jgi:hypothetical protein